jgi:ABC-type sugar transport system permease subunit
MTQNKIKNKSRVPFILFATIPPLISALLWYVYPNFSSFFMAFMNKNGEWGFEQFIRFFKEFQLESSEIRIALKNTLLTFGIMLISYPFKVLVSYFIYKKVPFHGFYRVVFFLPTIIFSVCVSLMFIRVVGPSGALAQAIGRWMGLDYTPELLADSRFANTVVLLHMMWLAFPGDLIIWGGNFARIPEEVLEAGRVDGTTWVTEFTKIILPMVWPTVSLQMVLMFAGLFNASGQVFLLTGGNYDTMTVSSWMYLQLQQNSAKSYNSNAYNYLSAVGIIITIIAVTLSFTVRKWANKRNNDVEF